MKARVSRIWNQTDPVTRYAWSQVRHRTYRFAALAGVEKPPCICGNNRVQMHHPDYSKPLEVGFLCLKCRSAEHWGRLKEPYEVHDLKWLAVADRVAFA